MNKMSIRSRPGTQVSIGTGQTAILMDDDELDLVCTLLRHCRLGTGTAYSTAAYQLMDKIDAAMGDDFGEDAAERVDLQCTIEDRQGNIVAQSDDDHYLTLEV